MNRKINRVRLTGALCTPIILLSMLSGASGAVAKNHEDVKLDKKPAQSQKLKQKTVQLDLALPAVSAEMRQYASNLNDEFADDDQFASVKLSDDRQSVTVYWHGDYTSELTEVLGELPAGLEATVEDTVFLPGDLRRAAAALLDLDGSNGTPNVVGAAAAFDGSEILVKVAEVPQLRSTAPVPDPGVLTELADVPAFPLSVETEEYVPAIGRQNDDLHIGGSRIYNRAAGNGCSTAFATSRSGGTEYGMLTASHCGVLGDQFVCQNGDQLFDMGKMTSRYTKRDAAVMTGTYYNAAVYTGGYTSTSYTAISGVAGPVINDEICYSGSYSGTICGNIVTNANYIYELRGIDTGIVGLLTKQNNNPNPLPAAGNGDSGGPGFLPVAAQAPNSGYYLYAGTIISAIPSGTGSSSVCSGVPGATGGRQCSPTVISTRAGAAAGLMGWTIDTL